MKNNLTITKEEEAAKVLLNNLKTVGEIHRGEYRTIIVVIPENGGWITKKIDNAVVTRNTAQKQTIEKPKGNIIFGNDTKVLLSQDMKQKSVSFQFREPMQVVKPS